jgi:hypothetical protein
MHNYECIYNVFPLLFPTTNYSHKLNGVILELDFEKAYDKVKWSFLHQTLRMKGFSDEWRSLINSFVSRGSVVIKSMMTLVNTSRH